jgi:hypothetical protein
MAGDCALLEYEPTFQNQEGQLFAVFGVGSLSEAMEIEICRWP